MPQQQFSVNMPVPKVAKLTKLAKQDGRTRSQYASQVLAKHLAEQEAKAAA
jgi:hypothetical protein